MHQTATVVSELEQVARSLDLEGYERLLSLDPQASQYVRSAAGSR